MSRFHRSLALAAVSLTAIVAAQGSALAGGFAVRKQSATAQGYTFAGAASGSGRLSSMFWNPATITMALGWQNEQHLSFISPDVRINPVAPTFPVLLGFGASGDIGQDAVVPAGYTSYQFSDSLWLGYSSSAPFGLVTDPRQNWAGQVYSRSSKIFTLNVNPVVGYRVNDWLSVGFGPMVQYFDTRLKRALAVTPNAPSLILEGDDIGFGFTAGLTLTPVAGTTLGIGYRSSIHHELEGTLATPGSVRQIEASLNLPDQVTVGLSQAIGPAFTVHLGFEWTNWSRLKAPAIVSSGVVVGSLPLNYEDGYFYSIGADYRVTDRLVLRAGVAYEQSPVDLETRGTRLPDDDRIWASVGATYQWSEKLSLDLAYTHIFAAENTRIDIGPGHQDYVAPLRFVADVESSANIFSAAIRYRWDEPARAIPAPIVRKY